MAKKPRAPSQKLTEAQALVMVAKAIDRLADAAEVLASPPKADAPHVEAHDAPNNS